MSCGWVFGGALTDQGRVTGTEVGVDVAVLGRGGMRLGETSMKTSSFAAEAAGVLGAFRVIMECATPDGDKIAHQRPTRLPNALT